MAEQRYIIPEEGLKVAMAAVEAGITERRDLFPREAGRVALEAFIRWQSEHPSIPTTEWLDEFNRAGEIKPFKDFRGAMIAEWQRQMYLAPKPSIPNSLIRAFWVSP